MEAPKQTFTETMTDAITFVREQTGAFYGKGYVKSCIVSCIAHLHSPPGTEVSRATYLHAVETIPARIRRDCFVAAFQYFGTHVDREVGQTG